MRAKFGNLGLVAAAYNAGPQRVQDWLSGKRTLPSETLAYVRSVTGGPAEEWKRPDARTWKVSIASDTPCVGTTKLAAKPVPSAPSAPPEPRAPWAVQLIGDPLESNALSRYAQLQKKYQAILGGREPLLMRTTMGNAAIWHRISIAADTREAAETLCSRLRAVGGSCLVPEQLNVARRTLSHCEGGTVATAAAAPLTTAVRPSAIRIAAPLGALHRPAKWPLLNR